MYPKINTVFTFIIRTPTCPARGFERLIKDAFEFFGFFFYPFQVHDDEKRENART